MPDAGCSARWPALASRASSFDGRSFGIVFRGFAGRLEGQTVRAVERRAKYLLVHLSSGDRLLMHLGMSGSFRVIRPGRVDPSRRRYYHDTSRLEVHDHVIFEMSTAANVSSTIRGVWVHVAADTRRARDAQIACAPRTGTAGGDIRCSGAGEEARRRRTSLKIALSDQRVVGGLGNIYVVEALHRAGLSPTRPRPRSSQERELRAPEFPALFRR